MTIVVHSRSGDGLALGLRLQDEGHAVGLYLEKERAQQIGRGLIYQIEDFPAAAQKADLVIFDQVGAGSLADLLREQGIPVLGASKWTDTIELDRIVGLRTFAAAGLAVPPWEPFADASFERARRYVEASGKRYVFKPCGNVATDKTYVAHDTDDMLAYLDHMEKTMEGEEGRRPPFLLQEFVEGVEVSIERWYARGRPIEALSNVTFEEKKFLVGGLGPAVGCAGNVVLPLRDPRLLAMSTGQLDRLAAAHKISGPIDLNQIVAEQDHRAYIIEATGRFGYDAMQAFMDLWPRPLAPKLLALARGADVSVRFPGNRVSAAVRVSIPPYPSGEAKEAAGTPILEDVLIDPRVWVGDVMLDAEDRLVCTGADAIVYVVTGQGRDAAAAFGSCYDWLKDVRTGDAQWRTDLAETTSRRIAQLRSWGYMTDGGRLAA